MKKLFCSALFVLLACVGPARAQNTLFPANPGDMIVKGGASAWVPVPGGTAGCVLTSNGPAAAPTWQCALALNFQLPPIPPNSVWGNATGAQAVPAAISISQFLNTIDYDVQRPPLPGATIYKGTDNLWHTAPPAQIGWVWTLLGNGLPGWAQTNSVPASAFLDLYVDHVSGVDDTHVCTSPTAPCRTIYHAYRLLQTGLAVASGGQVTIHSDCDFTESPPGAFLGNSHVGNGVVFIVGNESHPELCTWISTGNSFDDGAVVSLRGFRTQNAGSGQTWLSVPKGGLVVFANMVWGPAVGGAHMLVTESASLVAEGGGTYQVGTLGDVCLPACFNYHVINNSGTWEFAGQVVTIPAPLHFTAWYSGNNSGSNTSFGTNTFTGLGAGALSTGKPYEVSANATYRDFGLFSFPGNAAPSVTLGACNDAGCASTSFMYGSTPSLPDSITYFCALAYCSGGASAFVLPATGTLSRFRMTSSVAPALGQTYVGTVYFGTNATALTCTIANPNTSCADLNLAHSSTTPGSTGVTVQIALSAGAGAAAFSFSMQNDSSPFP